MGSENRRGIPPQATVKEVFMPLMRNERLRTLLSDPASTDLLLGRASVAISTLTPAGKHDLASYLLGELVSTEDNWNEKRKFSLSLLERLATETISSPKITDSYLEALDAQGETTPQIENVTALFDAGEILRAQIAADPKKHTSIVEKWNAIIEMLPEVPENEELKAKVVALRTTLAFQYIDDTYDPEKGGKLKEIFPHLIDKNKTYTKIAQELSIPKWDVATLSAFLRDDGLLGYRKQPPRIKVFSQKLKVDERDAGSSPELPLLKLPASVVDLAEASGLSQPTIRAIPREGHRVRIGTLKRFIVGARALGATLEELLPYEERLQEMQKQKELKQQEKEQRRQAVKNQKRKERAERAASESWKSSRALAESSGLDPSTIRRIKQGGSASEQSLGEFIRGARALGATLEELLPYEERLQEMQKQKELKQQEKEQRRQAVKNQKRKERAERAASEPWKSSRALAESSGLNQLTIQLINRGGRVKIVTLERFIRGAELLGATDEDLLPYIVRLQELQSKKSEEDQQIKARRQIVQNQKRKEKRAAKRGGGILSISSSILAEASGLNPWTIRRIKRGESARVESLEEFIRAAKSLGATSEDLASQEARLQSLQGRKRRKKRTVKIPSKAWESSRALAEASGLNQRTIQRVKRGEYVSIESLEEFIRGAELLGATPEELAPYKARLDRKQESAPEKDKLPQSETIWERNK